MEIAGEAGIINTPTDYNVCALEEIRKIEQSCLPNERKVWQLPNIRLLRRAGRRDCLRNS